LSRQRARTAAGVARRRRQARICAASSCRCAATTAPAGQPTVAVMCAILRHVCLQEITYYTARAERPMAAWPPSATSSRHQAGAHDEALGVDQVGGTGDEGEDRAMG